MHAAGAVAPWLSLYVPGLHEVHTAVPAVSAEYVPRGHAVHDAGVVAASRLEYAPAAHAVHAVAPTSPLYLPASQAGHRGTGAEE